MFGKKILLSFTPLLLSFLIFSAPVNQIEEVPSVEFDAVSERVSQEVTPAIPSSFGIQMHAMDCSCDEHGSDPCCDCGCQDEEEIRKL